MSPKLEKKIGTQGLHYTGLIILLLVLAAGFTMTLLSYNNPMPFGTEGYWRIAKKRAEIVVIMAVVALCHGLGTVAFQTVTGNRLLTPSIMGFESLYRLIATGMVFFFGSIGLNMISGEVQFLLQAGAMVLFSFFLYGWLLTGKNADLHTMLLIGIVLGGGLGALSSFMQRLLTPSDFDVLTARLFGNISNAQTEYLRYAIPIVLCCAVLILLRARRLNVLALGRDITNNLGLNHRREVIITLILVSVLMAMTTSLVGPMTFLGFLMATLAYQCVQSYDHRLIFPVAVLLGYVILCASYVILRYVFYAEGTVTIIIELIGGSVFLFFIMRKGRL